LVTYFLKIVPAFYAEGDLINFMPSLPRGAPIFSYFYCYLNKILMGSEPSFGDGGQMRRIILFKSKPVCQFCPKDSIFDEINQIAGL